MEKEWIFDGSNITPLQVTKSKTAEVEFKQPNLDYDARDPNSEQFITVNRTEKGKNCETELLGDVDLHVIGDGTSTIRQLINTFYGACKTQDKCHYKKHSERKWNYILGQINKKNATAVPSEGANVKSVPTKRTKVYIYQPDANFEYNTPESNSSSSRTSGD